MAVSVTNGAHTSPLDASMIFDITCKPNLDVPGAKAKPEGGITIAGILGKSAIINGLVKQGRIDVGGIKGQWEAFKSQIVRSPMHGVDQALVIAGITFLKQTHFKFLEYKVFKKRYPLIIL